MIWFLILEWILLTAVIFVGSWAAANNARQKERLRMLIILRSFADETKRQLDKQPTELNQVRCITRISLIRAIAERL